MSNSNIKCFKFGKYGHFAKEGYSNQYVHYGRVKHYARDYQSENKREETTNLLTKDVEKEHVLLLITRSSVPNT